MAHGWAGLLYALLGWARWKGQPPPKGTEDRLAQLRAAALPTSAGLRWPILAGGDASRSEAHMPGWCNGGAGHALLWVLAAEMLGEEHLAVAEAAAEEATAACSAAAVPFLCCGTVGVGFARLALFLATGKVRHRDAAALLAEQCGRAHPQRRLAGAQPVPWCGRACCPGGGAAAAGGGRAAGLRAAGRAMTAPPCGRFRDLPEGPEMILLPPGRFRMGSPAGEPGRCPDPQEGPQREMRIARPFAIAAETVTRALFARFVAETGVRHRGIVRRRADGTWGPDPERGFEDPGFPQAEDHPAVGLCWHDAVALAAWMARRTGRAYRLPTEAEWEYAARAGTTTAFWWGDGVGPDRANADFRWGFAGQPAQRDLAGRNLRGAGVRAQSLGSVADGGQCVGVVRGRLHHQPGAAATRRPPCRW